MFNRESVIRLLLRRPGALDSRIARWTVLALAGTGAGFLVWSGVIHLQLWSDGYKDISVIGPLFLVQGIASIVVAAVIVAFRWLALLAVGAVTGDKETQADGQMNRAAGSAQDAYGQAVDEVRSFASDQPVVALLSAMAVGVVIGFLLGRS